MQIQKTFRAKIHQLDSGTASVTWDESVAHFGSTKSGKVKGSIDGVPLQTVFMPMPVLHDVVRRHPIPPTQPAALESDGKAAE